MNYELFLNKTKLLYERFEKNRNKNVVFLFYFHIETRIEFKRISLFNRLFKECVDVDRDSHRSDD